MAAPVRSPRRLLILLLAAAVTLSFVSAASAPLEPKSSSVCSVCRHHEAESVNLGRFRVATGAGLQRVAFGNFKGEVVVPFACDASSTRSLWTSSAIAHDRAADGLLTLSALHIKLQV